MFAHHRERMLQQLHRADTVLSNFANTLLSLVHVRVELVISNVCLPQGQTLTEDEIGEHFLESGAEVADLHVKEIAGTESVLVEDVAKEVLNVGGIHAVGVTLAADVHYEFKVALTH